MREAAGKVRPTRRNSITERKRLAQELRNMLATYKTLASDEAGLGVDRRSRLMARIDAKWHALLALEGWE